MVAIAGCVVIAGSSAVPDVRSIVTAKYDGGDVTVQQRVYEARAVRDLLDDPGSVLVGEGFGATVDLSQSPDAKTIGAYRADLDEVDDVHLLPYDILLKRGLLGLAWLAALVLAILALTWSAIGQARRGDTGLLSVAAAVCVAIGFVNAVPAASHLLANPLTALMLGLLVSYVARPAPATEPSPASPALAPAA
jgi:hypothetical protein